MGDVFLWGYKECFCCFPVKGGNGAGSSRNESDYSRRGTQAIFPLLDCRSCEIFGLAHFLIFLLEKKSWPNRAPILINCQFSDYTIEDELLIVRNYRDCDSREAENWSGYLSNRVVRLISRRAGSISSLYGAITNLNAKKESPIRNGLSVVAYVQIYTVAWFTYNCCTESLHHHQ